MLNLENNHLLTKCLVNTMEPKEIKKLWEEYVSKLEGISVHKDEPELEEMKRIMNIDDNSINLTITYPIEMIHIDFTLFDDGSSNFNGP